MELGFESALKTGKDLPVGAVALVSDMTLGEGVASDQSTGHSHLHAEVNAVQKAVQLQADYPYLEPTTIVTNVEPCTDCQDFLATIPSIKSVMYLIPRWELARMNLVLDREPIEQSDERPYDVFRLDQPDLYRHGLALFETAHRETQGDNKGLVTFYRPKLLIAQRAFKSFQASF